ncbi:MAG: T9SS type A sorting domain-containing protein [Bacteroidetes bacterium]|nr:T9SS type A sorting domain-containing protein [Bacteroidota bacterium]
MQPLVDWKIRSGTATEVIDVNQIGNNAGAIKTYIQNYYINHPELKYILLAGDAQDVATPIFWGGAADPSYGYLNGNDSYAEVFVGRLSANTLAELQVQVAKILAYEINPDTTKTYYGHATVIGSNAGPGDDGEMDWEHARNLRTKLLAYTYANVQELYDGTHPGGNDASGDPLAFDFYTQLQNGISLATYTGHGTSSTFTTTGFNSNDISSLTNFNQWPYIWSVACANGDFNNGTCMAESFLRAEYNGQPTGAVATLMSSINQSWVPPMDAQDEFIDILTETYVNNIKRSFGGISVNGCMHMNDNYGPAGDEMTDTWCLFGDPSMQVRTAPPFVLAATHTTIISFNDNTLALSCNKQDGATVCLSNNGQLLDKQPLQNGQALLNFNSIGNQDTLQLTVYGYNCKPYLADINVLPVAQAEVQESGISIYPNPATSNLYLKTNTPILSIEILSMEGRMLKQWKENKNGAIDITIPIYDLSNGNYIAKIVINDKLFLKKFAVNR